MTPPRRTGRPLVLCLLALIVLTAIDLGTKAWAEVSLSKERVGADIPPACMPDDSGRYYFQRIRTEPVVWIDGYLELRYAENCGAAFGMLDEAPKWLRVGVFMSAGIVAVAALMWMFVTANGGPLFAISVPLVVSGALGNMVDRVRLGYVVDFVRFHLNDGWEWPTFNFADATITVGVVLLLLDGLRRPEPAAVEGSSGDPERDTQSGAGEGAPAKSA
ncbi:MAG: signal peptidase II [Myxococcales bacterium]|nr:signal peptidase II [Myxococcales bacterium]